jgi:hypothetical protein
MRTHRCTVLSGDKFETALGVQAQAATCGEYPSIGKFDEQFTGMDHFCDSHYFAGQRVRAGQNRDFIAIVESSHGYILVCGSNKKTDVVEHSEVIDHVGLLFNEPPGTAEMLFA